MTAPTPADLEAMADRLKTYAEPLTADDDFQTPLDAEAMLRSLARQALASGAETFQARVQAWLLACFGAEIAADKTERNHRFIEEALELVQSCGTTQSEAHQLVDYVYGRDQGDVNQEVGGVMITLAALCLANGLDIHAAGDTELARVWTKVEQIRAKQAAKPKHSPLHASPAAPSPTEVIARWIIAQSYATGHGDTVEDLLGELETQARERGLEEAAWVAEGGSFLTDTSPAARFGKECATAIRARKRSQQ